jgi:predicted transcriptional regulator
MAIQTTTHEEGHDKTLPSPYADILAELANGPLTAVPLSKITGFPPARVQQGLNTLVDIGIVRKHKLYTKSGAVKALYAIEA